MAGTTSWITVLTGMYWRTMEVYTYVSHYYGIYIRPLVSRAIASLTNKQEDQELCSYYPFRIIKANDSNLKEVYYPNIKGTDYKFIQVLIEVNGEKHEVNIDEFMVIGNVLFTNSFTEWILEDQLDIDITSEDDYTIHIIDQDVNVFTISKDEFMVIEKESWRKIQLETQDGEDRENEID